MLESHQPINVTMVILSGFQYLNLSVFEDKVLGDDFCNIYEVKAFKIISVVLSLIYLIFSNAFFISMILFEKVIA